MYCSKQNKAIKTNAEDVIPLKAMQQSMQARIDDYKEIADYKALLKATTTKSKETFL